MQYYFAPLEGITDSIFRHIHHKHFPGIDRYYTPFLSPTIHRCLTPKERRELSPVQQKEFQLVPQVLTKNPDDFIWIAQQCADLGYNEVNLNTGCPSGTVTAKGKGAGMLLDPDGLDHFLEQIFNSSPVSISIKTRIGFQEPDEFPALLDIFNRYPIKELTVHPRVRRDFYSGDVNMDIFRFCHANSKAPICYNGDLRNIKHIRSLTEEFADIKSVMIGRGLIADPGMVSPGGTTIEALSCYHDDLLNSYIDAFGGTRNAMFRLKEHWQYLIGKFDGSEALGKRLRKTTDIAEYKALTQEIFSTLPFNVIK